MVKGNDKVPNLIAGCGIVVILGGFVIYLFALTQGSLEINQESSSIAIVGSSNDLWFSFENIGPTLNLVGIEFC